MEDLVHVIDELSSQKKRMKFLFYSILFELLLMVCLCLFHFPIAPFQVRGQVMWVGGASLERNHFCIWSGGTEIEVIALVVGISVFRQMYSSTP
mgnify:CR=1 FL=1